MASIGICIAENKIMKPIILFASAICIALFGVLAFYHEPLIWVGGMVLIVWALAGAYVPKLRVWCACSVWLLYYPHASPLLFIVFIQTASYRSSLEAAAACSVGWPLGMPLARAGWR